jgi:NifU-like domain
MNHMLLRRRPQRYHSKPVTQIVHIPSSLLLFLLTFAWTLLEKPIALNSFRVGSAIATGKWAASRTILHADTIVSPFDNTASSTETATSVPTKERQVLEGPLELTWENVEAVLDEMRPYLIQDGGNVIIQDIDGPVVKLQLEVRESTSGLNDCTGQTLSSTAFFRVRVELVPRRRKL